MKRLSFLFLIPLTFQCAETLIEPTMPKTEDEARKLAEWAWESADAAQVLQKLLSEKKGSSEEITVYKEFLNRYAVVQNLLKKGSVQKLLEKIKIRELPIYKQQNYEELKERILKPLSQAIVAGDNFLLKRLMQDFEQEMNLSVVKNHVAKWVSTEHKLEVIKEARNFLYEIRSFLKTESKKEDFKKMVLSFNASINKFLEALDKLSIELYLKQIDFGQKLKHFFDFDDSKKTLKVEQEDINRMQQNIEPVIKLAKQIEHVKDEQFYLLEEIKQHRQKGTFEYNRSRLNEKAQKILEDARRLGQVLSLKQKKLMSETFERLKNYTATLAAKSNRYRRNYPSLFDSQIAEYTTELKGSSYGPHEVYEALGLTPGASTQEIESAYEIKRQESGISKSDWQAARNASTILRNSFGRETYDAFLKDYNTLVKLGFNPLTQEKSNVLIDFLNKESELSKLQISAKVLDQLNKLAFQVEEMSSILGSLKNSLEQKSLDQLLEDILG